MAAPDRRRAGTCRIAADRDAVNTGLCTPAVPSRSPALAERDSLAYLSLRRVTDPAATGWELGATGHGAAGTGLAERICRRIHAWDQHRNATPTITDYPAAAFPAQVVHAIRRPHTILTVTY